VLDGRAGRMFLGHRSGLSPSPLILNFVLNCEIQHFKQKINTTNEDVFTFRKVGEKSNKGAESEGTICERVFTFLEQWVQQKHKAVRLYRKKLILQIEIEHYGSGGVLM